MGAPLRVPAAGAMSPWPIYVTDRFRVWLMAECARLDQSPGQYLDAAFGGAKRGGWNDE